MTVDRHLEVPQGTFVLDRHPPRPRQPLRAWDAADELVLHHLAGTAPPGRLAIANDAFGALAVALADHEPRVLVDGEHARIALGRNLAENGRAPIEPVSTLEPGPNPIDTLVIKVPRSRGQLEDQLHRLRPLLADEATVVGAAMARHIHASTLELFETIIGPTVTSRATRKARLAHVTPDPGVDPGPNPWPKQWSTGGVTTVNHGGVFSAERLDPGTRLLLDHRPDVPAGATIVDLGCGNGIIGMTLARQREDIDLTLVDESHRALASARAGWAVNFGDRPARFLASDRLVNAVDADSVDVVVTNPPFHEDRAVGDATAWEFFIDADRVLRPGGTLIAVGNRHLGHHAKLAKIFGASTVLASDAKYVLHCARKR